MTLTLAQLEALQKLSGVPICVNVTQDILPIVSDTGNIYDETAVLEALVHVLFSIPQVKTAMETGTNIKQ